MEIKDQFFTSKNLNILSSRLIQKLDVEDPASQNACRDLMKIEMKKAYSDNKHIFRKGPPDKVISYLNKLSVENSEKAFFNRLKQKKVDKSRYQSNQIGQFSMDREKEVYDRSRPKPMSRGKNSLSASASSVSRSSNRKKREFDDGSMMGITDEMFSNQGANYAPISGGPCEYIRADGSISRQKMLMGVDVNQYLNLGNKQQAAEEIKMRLQQRDIEMDGMDVIDPQTGQFQYNTLDHEPENNIVYNPNIKRGQRPPTPDFTLDGTGAKKKIENLQPDRQMMEMLQASKTGNINGNNRYEGFDTCENNGYTGYGDFDNQNFNGQQQFNQQQFNQQQINQQQFNQQDDYEMQRSQIMNQNMNQRNYANQNHQYSNNQQSNNQFQLDPNMNNQLMQAFSQMFQNMMSGNQNFQMDNYDSDILVSNINEKKRQVADQLNIDPIKMATMSVDDIEKIIEQKKRNIMSKTESSKSSKSSRNLDCNLDDSDEETNKISKNKSELIDKLKKMEKNKNNKKQMNDEILNMLMMIKKMQQSDESSVNTSDDESQQSSSEELKRKKKQTKKTSNNEIESKRGKNKTSNKTLNKKYQPDSSSESSDTKSEESVKTTKTINKSNKSNISKQNNKKNNHNDSDSDNSEESNQEKIQKTTSNPKRVERITNMSACIKSSQYTEPEYYNDYMVDLKKEFGCILKNIREINITNIDIPFVPLIDDKSNTLDIKSDKEKTKELTLSNGEYLIDEIIDVLNDGFKNENMDITVDITKDDRIVFHQNNNEEFEMDFSHSKLGQYLGFTYETYEGSNKYTSEKQHAFNIKPIYLYITNIMDEPFAIIESKNKFKQYVTKFQSDIPELKYLMFQFRKEKTEKENLYDFYERPHEINIEIKIVE